jgi:hypothetical protein
MVCDVMEAVRPEVDAWLLTFLTRRTVRRQDFLELRNGQCRLMPELAWELAQTAGLWAVKLGPVVEDVAQSLYRHATAPERARPWAQSKSRSGRQTAQSLPTPLTESRRRRGRPARAVEGKPKIDLTADVSCGPHPSVFRGELASRTGAQSLWLPGSRLTKEQFLRQVIPALREIPAAQIAKAVGLSEPYCAKIRSGRGIPHQHHWAAFARLVVGTYDGGE